MKKIISVLLLILFIFVSIPFSQTYASSTNKKAILIILDRTSLNDYSIYNLPNIKKLINTGALGLMNTKTAGSYSDASAYLTIGTGTRAISSSTGSLSFNTNENYGYESASDLYTLFTGNKPQNYNIVNIGIQDLITASSKLNYKVTPGLLGNLLEKNGIPVYVIGNSDVKTPDGISYNRFSALIGINKSGTAKGDISDNLLVSDKNSPYFLKADYKKLYDKFLEYSKNGGFIIIDPGDIFRADEFSVYTSVDMANKYKQVALKNADEFIGKIFNSIDINKDLLIIAVPFPSNNDISTNNLITPLIITGNGFTKGIATSSTTKREGIIANTDIAPTVLSYFNIKQPVEMLGHNIISIPKQNALNYLENINKMIVSVHNARTPVLKSYVIFLIIILILYLLLLFLKKDHLKYMVPIILAIMTVPFTLLLLPLLGPLSIYMNIIAVILITFIIVLSLMILLNNDIDRFMTISLISAFALIFDLLTNSHLMKNSILGYDVIEGARYYGIGNEYMGVLIGSSIMGLMTLIEKYKTKTVKIFSILTLIFIFFLMVLPQYGAKVGGFITGFMAFGTIILLLLGLKINKKTFSFMFIIMIISLFSMFVISMFLGTTTHMAQTALIVKHEGINALIEIFTRKLQMEFKLMRYTIWSWVLIISILMLFILSYKPTGILKNIFKNYTYIYYGFFGSVVGMLFALAFNDAGIVAAATTCIYAIPPILILLQKPN